MPLMMSQYLLLDLSIRMMDVFPVHGAKIAGAVRVHLPFINTYSRRHVRLALACGEVSPVHIAKIAGAVRVHFPNMLGGM